MSYPEKFELLLEYTDGLYKAVTETESSDFKLVSFGK